MIEQYTHARVRLGIPLKQVGGDRPVPERERAARVPLDHHHAGFDQRARFFAALAQPERQQRANFEAAVRRPEQYVPGAMQLSDYQSLSRATAVYPQAGTNLLYPTLGLCGEAGEVAEKIKKMVRDDAGVLTAERRSSLAKELGDVLWYVAQIATEADLELDAIAAANIEKLGSRQRRNVLHGSGDDR